ncbi:MAG TPA: hypothetical protein GYA08_03855 [Chloroflexi bacterium]|nr:hypothetical protein [Chloroflexota bacterium]
MITPPNRPPGFADAGRNCPVQARMRLNGEITPLRAASTGGGVAAVPNRSEITPLRAASTGDGVYAIQASAFCTCAIAV